MTAKLTLPLEVGKKYVRRDGQVVELIKVLNVSSYPFVSKTIPGGNIGNLTASGRWGCIDDHPTDLVADYIEPAKPKGHPHAESMRLYAEDATECAEPWTRWEVCLSGRWEELTVQPSWAPHFQYRRKPKTIRVGAFDVPEPMREAPPVGTIIFMVDPTIDAFVLPRNWAGHSAHLIHLQRGLYHKTREAAELHAKALISLTEAHNG